MFAFMSFAFLSFVSTSLLLKFVFHVPHGSECTRYFSFLNGSSRHWEIQGDFCCWVAQLCLIRCDPLDCGLHNVDWLRKPHQKKKKKERKKTSSRSCDLRGVSSQREREISLLTLLSHPGSCISSAGVSSTHDSEHLLTDWRLTAEFQVVWFKVGVWLVPQGNGTRGKSCSDVALDSWGSIL